MCFSWRPIQDGFAGNFTAWGTFSSKISTKQSNIKTILHLICNAPAAPLHLYTALDNQSIIIHTRRTHTDSTQPHTRRRYGNRRVFGIQAKGHFYLRMVSGRKDNKGNRFNFFFFFWGPFKLHQIINPGRIERESRLSKRGGERKIDK